MTEIKAFEVKNFTCKSLIVYHDSILLCKTKIDKISLGKFQKRDLTGKSIPQDKLICVRSNTTNNTIFLRFKHLRGKIGSNFEILDFDCPDEFEQAFKQIASLLSYKSLKPYQFTAFRAALFPASMLAIALSFSTLAIWASLPDGGGYVDLNREMSNVSIKNEIYSNWFISVFHGLGPYIVIPVSLWVLYTLSSNIKTYVDNPPRGEEILF